MSRAGALTLAAVPFVWLGMVLAISFLDLEAHLPVMCNFWQAVAVPRRAVLQHRVAGHTDLHATVPLRTEHFAPPARPLVCHRR